MLGYQFYRISVYKYFQLSIGRLLVFMGFEGKNLNEINHSATKDELKYHATGAAASGDVIE